jgi:uncharacterized protein YkwD
MRPSLLIFLLVVGPFYAQEIRKESTSSPDWSAIAREVLNEVNQVRQDPPAYAQVLKSRREHYKGRRFEQPGRIPILTQEGVEAVDEAINFLVKSKPLPAIEWSDGLALAAGELALDQGKTGQTGHGDSDGSRLEDRINHHGRWSGQIAENVAYGHSSARETVIAWLIDDGVSSRGHRKNLFQSTIRLAGVAGGPHPGFRTVWVIDFAGRFDSSASPSN